MKALNTCTDKGFTIFNRVCIFTKKWLDKLFMPQFFPLDNEVIFLAGNLLSIYVDVEDEKPDCIGLTMVTNHVYQLTSSQSINFLHRFPREVFLSVPNLLKIYDSQLPHD